MYLVNNVEDISLVIFGYLHGLGDDQEADSLGELLADFRTFVNNYYKHKKNDHWARLIRFHSGSDVHSREIFADLFSRFLKLRNNK